MITVTRGRARHLPDLIIDTALVDRHYTAQYCTQASLREAVSLTEPFYRHEYVDHTVAEAWRVANPTAFVQLENADGTLCASFGILALDPSFMDQFIKGRVIDNELVGSDILDRAHSARSRRLYISGVVVREPSSTAGNKRAVAMVWAMVTYLKVHYSLRRERTLYALAVSRQSETLLKKLGFELAAAGHDRRDKLNLYSITICKRRIAEVLAKVGDHSSICTCRYEDTP